MRPGGLSWGLRQLLDKSSLRWGWSAVMLHSQRGKMQAANNRDPQRTNGRPVWGICGRRCLYKTKIIVCLGRIAAGVILGREVKMMREHGGCIKVKNFTIIPTFHPAALLHNRETGGCEADFRIIGEKTG